MNIFDKIDLALQRKKRIINAMRRRSAEEIIKARDSSHQAMLAIDREGKNCDYQRGWFDALDWVLKKDV